jgi:hypothetical protein
MARLVDSGRAAPVRLKLYLGILCLASAGDPPHATSAPARAWAELLDLADPGGHGQRRVRDAIKYLEQQRLIRREQRPGHPQQLRLLREDGTGVDYTPPHTQRQDEDTKLAVEHHFVQLPPAFWRAGWCATLTNNGVATWLALLHATRSGTNRGVWVSPSQVTERYAISEDTWSRGIGELRDCGLLRIAKQPVSEAFGFQRVRNKYTLRMKRIEQKPLWVVADD